MFAPSPADFTTFGPLPDAAAALLAHIDQERRRSWEVASSDLAVHPDGTVSARGHVAVRFERAGFDALLRHYTACFPRAPTLLSRLYEKDARVWADVWRTLFDPHEEGVPLDIKVHERTTSVGRAVWATTPTSYPGAYHVGKLVSDIAARWDVGAPPMAVVQYTAAESRLRLVLPLRGRSLVVQAVDQYDGGGVACSVLDAAGVDQGDPCPTLKTRRRATASGDAASTVAEGVLARVRFLLSSGGGS